MENFFPTTEKLDATLKKKPKEDPVGLFLSRFDKALDVEHAVAEKIDFSYLSPAQRAESMWAVFQDARNLVKRMGKADIQESELQRLRQNVGVLKNFYDDPDTQKTYTEQHQRHISEIEAINGDSEKRKTLDREIKKNQKTADVCARKIFSERGGKSSELDILLFETSKRQLNKKREELTELIESNPELGGLARYEKIKEGAEQLCAENFIWADSRIEQLEATEEAALSGKPVLLSGESGTGKTRLVEQASLKLTGQINNLTPGKDTRFQDLIAKPKISPQGETYYEYKEIGEAATGKVSTLEEKLGHQGRIVADDEFNLLPEAEQTERLARISSWTPGKKVRMPVTNREEKIAPNFLYCAMVNLASERYARKKIPPEVLRKFAKVDVGYLEQSAENPEIYEAILSALLDKNGRLRVAKGEISPAYEFREESKTIEKEGQQIKQSVNIRELKVSEEKDGKAAVAGGFAWRMANALNEINKSFSHKETVLKAKGEAQFLKDLIIDIGTVLGWMKEYGTAGRGKNLEIFFADKMQKEFLSREAYSLEDRQLVKEFLKYFDIDLDKKTEKRKADQEFEIMTPLEIGLLSPRVKYEKVVSEEPVLAESYRITSEGKRIEYKIEKYREGDREFLPGQIFPRIDSNGKKYAEQFLGISKEGGEPVIVPYKKEKIVSREEKTVSSVMKAEWKNPETQKEQAIEIDLEKILAEQKTFYKDRLNLEIDENEIKSIWKDSYAEIKSEVEKYGYDEILIVPENLPEEEVLNQKLIETMQETVGKTKKKVAATWQGDNFKKDGGSFAGVRNSYAPEYRIVLTHSVQNIEDHPILKVTLGKNVMQVTGLEPAEVDRRITNGINLPVDCKLEINGQEIEIKAEGESLEEYQIQQAMYFEKTDEHLDSKSNSWVRLLKSCSGSRVVGSYWNPGGRQLYVLAYGPGFAYAYLGLRLSRSFKKLT
ncbi:MAG: AAA family ATPase [Parcubacteria group bacterium]